MAFRPFHKAGPGDTTFLFNKSYSEAWDLLLGSEASKVYVESKHYGSLQKNRHPAIHNLVPSPNPKLAFIKELSKTDTKDSYVARVEMGNNNKISDGVMITHTTIGNDCVIYPNCTLGFPALAMERDTDNKLYDFRHIGRLEIGNNVLIGQLTNIARGTIDKTIIEDDVRTDAHVNIAHNCHVRRGAILAVASILGGSVDIGTDSWIGMNATIREHIRVGKNALVGMGAVVIDDVPDNDIVAGCPAVSIKHKVTLSDASRFMMVGYQVK